MVDWHMKQYSWIAALALAATLSSASWGQAPATPATTAQATAIFAGGCFWCVESDFEKLAGVTEVESGYTGGKTNNPSYEQVSAGGTGHTEAVRVFYNPQIVSYAQLLDYFWHHIDPTVKDRQFCDVGRQYRSAIFWQTEDEHRAAESSRAALLGSGKFKTIYTELAPASAFWPAEAYHQDYYKKNPLRYRFYRQSCGRDARVAEVWGGK